jgi:hypothetical protein
LAEGARELEVTLGGLALVGGGVQAVNGWGKQVDGMAREVDDTEKCIEARSTRMRSEKGLTASE